MRGKFTVKPSEGSGLDRFDVAIFTASCDDAETNTKFAEALKLDYPILSDPDRKVARAYGVLDPERKLPRRWTYYIGEDGKILHIDKKVNARQHGADVVARLKKLGIKAKKKKE